jgi:hypothetical protein
VPSPPSGINLLDDIIYGADTCYTYTDATGAFSLSLITHEGLYYTVDITIGGNTIVTSKTFVAGVADQVLDISDVATVPAVPDVVDGFLTEAGVAAQWVLDQIHAERIRQLGLAAAL